MKSELGFFVTYIIDKSLRAKFIQVYILKVVREGLLLWYTSGMVCSNYGDRTILRSGPNARKTLGSKKIISRL